jgi:hypothetical protein
MAFLSKKFEEFAKEPLQKYNSKINVNEHANLFAQEAIRMLEELLTVWT